MRYNVGEVLHTIKLVHADSKPDRCFFMAYIPRGDERDAPRPTVEIIDLTVEEHHKVPWEFGTDDDKPYDGYVLKDAEGNDWHNQYPTACYGQISTEGDYRFCSVRVIGEPVLDKPLENKSYTETKLLTHFLSELYAGIFKREEYCAKNADYKELPVEAQQSVLECTEKLKAHFNDVVEAFSKAHPNLSIGVKPFAFKSKDGEQIVLDGCFKVDIVPFRVDGDKVLFDFPPEKV